MITPLDTHLLNFPSLKLRNWQNANRDEFIGEPIHYTKEVICKLIDKYFLRTYRFMLTDSLQKIYIFLRACEK